MTTSVQTQAVPTPKPALMATQSNLLQHKCACGGIPGPSGECEYCRNKRLGLQRHDTDQAEPDKIPPIVDEVLRSPGQPLDRSSRAFMESRFGHDFSRVRVHADSRASESARSLKAHAYTLGKDIVFDEQAYKPSTFLGRYVLAHELTHIVQRDRRVGSPVDTRIAAEREASASALSVAAGKSVQVSQPASPLALLRLDWEVLGTGIGAAAGILLGGAAVAIARGAGAALGPLGALGILGVGALAGGLIGYLASPSSDEEDEQEATSLDNPQFRKLWEKKLQEGVKLLEEKREKEGGCRFPPTLDPSGQKHELRFDRENWVPTEQVLTPEGKPSPTRILGAIGYRPRSAPPYEAVDLLFKFLGRWECDCRLFPEMALLYAWRHTLDGKPKIFNSRFAGLQLNAQGTVGLMRESLDPDDAASWDGAPVGTKVAWINKSPKAKAPFEYEHAIKVYRGKSGDPDRYVAHPFPGEHTEAEIKDLLAQQASDYPWRYEVTEQALTALEEEKDFPSDIRQLLAGIKGQAVVGLPQFLELSPIKNLRIEAVQRQRDPADVQRWINLILKHTRREPLPKDRKRYIDENIERQVLQVPK